MEHLDAVAVLVGEQLPRPRARILVELMLGRRPQAVELFAQIHWLTARKMCGTEGSVSIAAVSQSAYQFLNFADPTAANHHAIVQFHCQPTTIAVAGIDTSVKITSLCASRLSSLRLCNHVVNLQYLISPARQKSVGQSLR